ncbi:MAG: prephenate dehydrogenase [Elusimicrobiota bacterium]
MLEDKNQPYNKVSIIGIGLIGGSIGLALLEKKLARSVSGWGRNPDHLRKAIEKGACTEATTSIKKTLADAEIVILCTPVKVILNQLEEIAKFAPGGAIIMDVGSVKEKIVDAAFKSGLISEKLEFIGAHPMAGSEKTGVENSSEDLFNHAPCILTPHLKNSQKNLARAKLFWQKLGADIVEMTPLQHDISVGFLSHLPHVVSSVLARVSCTNIENPDIISKVAGPSFRENTRIAGASAELWSQIYIQNKEQVIKAVEAFINSLDDFKSILTKEDNDKLSMFIEEGALYRKKYVQKIKEGK